MQFTHVYMTALRLKYFEMTLPRLLHLIAVHPDFKVDQEGLKDSSEYEFGPPIFQNAIHANDISAATSTCTWTRSSLLRIYISSLSLPKNAKVFEWLYRTVLARSALDPASQLRFDILISSSPLELVRCFGVGPT